MKMHHIDSHRENHLGHYLDDKKPLPIKSARTPHNVDAVSISERIDSGIDQLQ